jgi:hypothetical protein
MGEHDLCRVMSLISRNSVGYSLQQMKSKSLQHTSSSTCKTQRYKLALNSSPSSAEA